MITPETHRDTFSVSLRSAQVALKFQIAEFPQKETPSHVPKALGGEHFLLSQATQMKRRPQMEKKDHPHSRQSEVVKKLKERAQKGITEVEARLHRIIL